MEFFIEFINHNIGKFCVIFTKIVILVSKLITLNYILELVNDGT